MNERNIQTAVRRGQRRRMNYYTEVALAHGLTPIQAARVAVECERWFLQGVHMSVDRIVVECELAQRKAVA